MDGDSWMLAKMVVQATDYVHSQMVEHLLKASNHLCRKKNLAYAIGFSDPLQGLLLYAMFDGGLPL